MNHKLVLSMRKAIFAIFVLSSAQSFAEGYYAKFTGSTSQGNLCQVEVKASNHWITYFKFESNDSNIELNAEEAKRFRFLKDDYFGTITFDTPNEVENWSKINIIYRDNFAGKVSYDGVYNGGETHLDCNLSE